MLPADHHAASLGFSENAVHAVLHEATPQKFTAVEEGYVQMQQVIISGFMAMQPKRAGIGCH